MILVTGATGFLGKRVCRQLRNAAREYYATSLSLGTDLRQRTPVLALFGQIKPTHVLNCAAYVGGIQFGYRHPAELFSNNLQMTINLLDACSQFGVRRMVNPISNCAYPGKATLFKEAEFWDGPLHESVMVYGLVRKASWVGAWAYAKQYGLDTLNIILSNMYGPEDHFDEERSHALGALIMKMVRAKRTNAPQVTIWGSGAPVREWLHVDDGAEAMIRSLDVPAIEEPVNIGVGKGISIADMAHLIKDFVGYQGELVFDHSRPDGAPHKSVDGARGATLFGWVPSRNFRKGVEDTIHWYIANSREAA